MTLLTFIPAPGYTANQGGVLNAGGGRHFDVGQTLSNNGGVIYVEDTADPTLVMALDEHPGVVRATGTVQTSDTILPVQVHSTGATPGTTLVRGVDGYYTSIPSGYASIPAPSGDTTGATDQAALNTSIINAGANAEVVFGPGTYWVTGLTLNQTGQRWILHPQTTIKLAANATSPVILINGIGCILEGEGIIDGNGLNQTSAQAFGVLIGTSALTPTVKGGLRISNTLQHGLSSSNGAAPALPAGTLIEDLFVNNPLQSGVFLQTANGADAVDIVARRILVDKSAQSSSTATGNGVVIRGNFNGVSAGYLRNVSADDIYVRLPTSPTNPLIGVQLLAGSGGAAIGCRITRPRTSGGSSGVIVDRGQDSKVSEAICDSPSSVGVELASCTNCTASNPTVRGNGITGFGVSIDNGTSGTSLQCSVIGGTITGCTLRPVNIINATKASVTGTVISSGTALYGAYFQNSPSGSVSAATLVGGGSSTFAVQLDGAASSGFVIGDCTVDNYTTGLVGVYSTTANDVINNIHIGTLNITNMATVPIVTVNSASASGVAVGTVDYGEFEVVRALGTTNSPTTTSTSESSWAIIPQMTVTKNFHGGWVEVSFSGAFTTSTNPTSFLDIAVLLDGAAPTGIDNVRTIIPSGVSQTGAGVWNGSATLGFPITPGSHTIAVGWAVGAGTGTAYFVRRQLLVKEFF